MPTSTQAAFNTLPPQSDGAELWESSLLSLALLSLDDQLPHVVAVVQTSSDPFSQVNRGRQDATGGLLQRDPGRPEL